VPVLLLFIFIPVFWFLIVRPQQQQRRAHQAVVAALAVGDHVMTVGGLIGTLTEVTEETVRLDAGDGTELTFGRTFVRQLMPEPDRGVAPGSDAAVDLGLAGPPPDGNAPGPAHVDLRNPAPDRPVREVGP